MFVLTIQPAHNDLEKIEALYGLGFKAFRVNFGRAEMSDNIELIRSYRYYFDIKGCDCTIFIDLPGAKTRLGLFVNGYEWITNNAKYCFDSSNIPGDHRRVYIKDSSFHGRCNVGDRLILNNDVLFEIINKKNNKIECRVIKGGKIYSRCGISIKNRYFENTNLTQYDLFVLAETEGLADFICPSFVDNLHLLHQVGSHKSVSTRQGIIAKIESPLGVKNLDSIVKEANGTMLCRGDLGMFYSRQEINIVIARQMRQLTHDMGKVLVFATDYFKSMINKMQLDKTDESTLMQALALKPDYVIINETSYSDNWFEIAQLAARIEQKSLSK